MRSPKLSRTGTLLATGLVAGLVGIGSQVGNIRASDHQDTPDVELKPQLDIDDVFAFPGSSDDRIAIAVTFASPLAGSANARFDPNALYQIKVDNNQDGREDMVLQFSFDEMANGTQTFDVIGPVAPSPATGNFAGPNSGFAGPGSGTLGFPAVRDRFSSTAPAIRRAALNTTVTGNLAAGTGAAAGTLQAWAGLRDDPFYIDLEQFFRIVPDRRPTAGPLSQIGGVRPAAPGTIASSFRPKCTAGTPNPNQSQFSGAFGCAVDLLRGFNALAIVVELPESQLVRGGNGQLGIWATVSR